MICHPVSPFGKSSGYAKGSSDESKTEIFLIIPLTFKNEIIFHSKGGSPSTVLNITDTFKYHVFAPMGRFQLELICLYFPPSFHLIVGCFCPVGLSLL